MSLCSSGCVRLEDFSAEGMMGDPREDYDVKRESYRDEFYMTTVNYWSVTSEQISMLYGYPGIDKCSASKDHDYLEMPCYEY